jgi:hypothetical protein
VILLAAILLLAAVGLLAAGLAEGSTALQWSSFASSVLAAVVLAVGEVRRRRAARAGGTTPAASWAEPAAPPSGPTGGPAGPPVEAAPAATPAEDAPAVPPPAAHAAAHTSVPSEPAGDPPVEEVEVTDLLVVLDLTDEVLVIDEHPRYHLAGCAHLAGQDTFPMPMVEARTDGFTPCATCAPDRHLAQRERTRRAGA